MSRKRSRNVFDDSEQQPQKLVRLEVDGEPEYTLEGFTEVFQPPISINARQRTSTPVDENCLIAFNAIFRQREAKDLREIGNTQARTSDPCNLNHGNPALPVLRRSSRTCPKRVPKIPQGSQSPTDQEETKH